MRLTNILTAGAALGLATAPVAAQAASQPLPSRQGSQLTEAENLRGGFIIPLIAVVAIILGILAATGGGDDEPTSP